MCEGKTDKEIIEIYKNGNEEIFKCLVDKYSQSIYNLAVHFGKKEVANDAVQETFIKIWKNLNKFDKEKSSFKTWLFKIAKNTIIDLSRKKRFFLFSDLEETVNDEDYSIVENIEDDTPLPDEILEKMENIEKLKNIIEKMPKNYKEVLVLHYQEDMTFEEIGEILEKPLNTVKSWHQRAIKVLRKEITI